MVAASAAAATVAARRRWVPPPPGGGPPRAFSPSFNQGNAADDAAGTAQEAVAAVDAVEVLVVAVVAVAGRPPPPGSRPVAAAAATAGEAGTAAAVVPADPEATRRPMPPGRRRRRAAAVSDTHALAMAVEPSRTGIRKEGWGVELAGGGEGTGASAPTPPQRAANKFGEGLGGRVTARRPWQGGVGTPAAGRKGAGGSAEGGGHGWVTPRQQGRRAATRAIPSPPIGGVHRLWRASS